jgi:hypothetical protein
MNSALSSLLGGETKARILGVLLAHPGVSYHLRGLAQAADTDSGNTSKLLRSLVKTGLVLAAPDSHSTRYSINDRSPLVAPLRQLFATAGSLIADLRKVAAGLDASYVGVFGSVASGTDDADSDLDILVVGDVTAVSSQAAFKTAGRKHRRIVNTIAVTKSEFANRLTEGGAFWTSVAKGKRIDLKGRFEDVAISKPVAKRRTRISSMWS